MTAELVARPAVDGLDVPRLLEWLATAPPPEEVTATREEALRRADYLRGRDAGQVVELRKAARIVEWEMAHRWPANGAGGARKDDRPTLGASNVDDREAWQRVYAVGAQPREWILSRTEPEELTQAAIIRGPAVAPHVSNNSGMNEWYTPPEYIEAARTVLGHIALDPASSVKAQEMVRASVFFTAEDDGLSRDWFGPVWLNPPYAQPLVGQFIDKLVTSNVEGICLVNNATETEWGAQLLAAAQRVCFPTGRIRFLDPAGNPGAPLQGQMVAYLGDQGGRFAQVFSRFGVVLDG